MSFGGRKRTKAVSPLPFPHRIRWSLVAGVLGACLLAIPWWVGSHHSAWEASLQSWGWARWPSGWLAQWAGGVGELLGGGHAGWLWGIRVECLILLGFTLVFWRWAMLHYYAYKPGSVDVQPLVAAESEHRPEPSVVDLTARFRKQLSEIDLFAPTSLAASAPAESFLDLLGDVNLEPQKLGTSLLRLTSQLRPKIAYRVSGVLMFRDKEPHFGLTVTVTSYGIRGSRAETIWESSWEEAVSNAAYWVVATLLPVTRAGRKPPWRDWTGRDLPVELFTAYHCAQKFSRDRKFDAALDRYYEAVHLDPTNVHLRNQIGATQESMGLYLEALETYYGALNLRMQGHVKDNKKLWSCRWWLPRPVYQWQFWKQPGVLQARYRLGVVLGISEMTAKQWCENNGTTAQEIRKSVTPAFAERYWRAARDLKPDPKSPAKSRVRQSLEKSLHRQRLEKSLVRSLGKILDPPIENEADPPKPNENEVALVFQRASAQEMYQLARDYRVARLFLLYRGDRPTLDRSALRVNRDVWTQLRLVKVRLKQPGGLIRPAFTYSRWRLIVQIRAKMMERLARKLTCETNEKKGLREIKHLKKRLKKAFLRPKMFHRYWQGHYNAACAYAVALDNRAEARGSRVHITTDAEERAAKRIDDRLATLACHELKEAVRRAEAGIKRIKRSWVLFDDPDMTRLRSNKIFVRFTRETYPHSTPDLKLELDSASGVSSCKIEISAYQRELLESVGKIMEEVWRQRNTQSPEIQTARDWFTTEGQIWELVDTVSADTAGYWLDRVRLRKKIQSVADCAKRIEVDITTKVPEFDKIVADTLDGSYHNGATVSTEKIPSRLDVRLRRLHKLVEYSQQNSPIESSHLLLASSQHCDSAVSARLDGAIKQICTHYVATWKAFSELFEMPANPLTNDRFGGNFDSFKSALQQLEDDAKDSKIFIG
ncbi:tetratricopeptide (TPR) repeat protein [Catenulispora sp. MAP12-49]|uniref:hypothetical protein n=1 Tax=Catenulispora sp. MAP12-49 TaxID=3156302 RepID=UPI0035153ED2